MAGREDRKKELIAELAGARARMDRSTVAVRRAADVPARVRQNFSHHIGLWLGGAALFGVLLAKAPRRTKKVYVDAKGEKVAVSGVAKTGLLLTVAKIAFDAARPLLIRLATERLQPIVEDYVNKKQRRKTA